MQFRSVGFDFIPPLVVYHFYMIAGPITFLLLGLRAGSKTVVVSVDTLTKTMPLGLREFSGSVRPEKRTLKVIEQKYNIFHLPVTNSLII